MNKNVIYVKQVFEALFLIDKLNDKHGIVLDYIYMNGYTQSEAAEEFKIPIGQ